MTKGLCSFFLSLLHDYLWSGPTSPGAAHALTCRRRGGACIHSRKGSKVLRAEGMGTIILLVTKTAWSLMHELKLFAPPTHLPHQPPLMLHPRESDRGGSPDFINTWINFERDSTAAHSAEEITGLKDQRNSETERRWTSGTWILRRLHGCQWCAVDPKMNLK